MEIVKTHIPENPKFFEENKEFAVVINDKKVTVPVAKLEEMQPEEFETFVKSYLEFDKKTEEDYFVNRLLDAFEIHELEQEIVSLNVSQLPELKTKLEEVTAAAKSMVSTAKNMLNSCFTMIDDYSKQLRVGVKKIAIEEPVIIIPFGNKKFYFTKINEKYRLVNEVEIPGYEQEKWYNQVNSNNALLQKGLFETDNLSKAI